MNMRVLNCFTPTFSDPIQLNMLYEQSKHAILIGTHPVAMDIARQLAAFMIQMQYGDHKEEKHKPGIIKYVLQPYTILNYSFLSSVSKASYQKDSKEKPQVQRKRY